MKQRGKSDNMRYWYKYEAEIFIQKISKKRRVKWEKFTNIAVTQTFIPLEVEKKTTTIAFQWLKQQREKIKADQ